MGKGCTRVGGGSLFLYVVICRPRRNSSFPLFCARGCWPPLMRIFNLFNLCTFL